MVDYERDSFFDDILQWNFEEKLIIERLCLFQDEPVPFIWSWSDAQKKNLSRIVILVRHQSSRRHVGRTRAQFPYCLCETVNLEEESVSHSQGAIVDSRC
jgi:hypothetical protein